MSDTIESLRAEVERERAARITAQAEREQAIEQRNRAGIEARAEVQKQMAALSAEVEELRAVSHCRCGDQFTADDPGMCGVCQRIKSADVEALKVDAERLDYIASNARCDPKMDGQHVWWPTSFNHRLIGPNLRAAIDAARAQEQSDG